MTTNTEVAGISIGITADIEGLETSVNRANDIVDKRVRQWQNRKIGIEVNVRPGPTWGTIESDLNALVARVAKGNKIGFDLDFEIPKGAVADLKAKVQNEVRGKLTGIKVPLDIDAKVNVDVAVAWHWADGQGPPGDVGGGTGGGGGPATKPPTTGRGKKRTVAADTEVTTPEVTQAPPAQAALVRQAPKTTAPRRVVAKVAAPPAVQQEAAVVQPPETRASGIAGMAPGTPATLAERTAAATNVINTAAAGIAATWTKATRKALEAAGAKIPVGAQRLEALTGDAEGTPKGVYRYHAGGMTHTIYPQAPRPAPMGYERGAPAPVAAAATAGPSHHGA